MDTVTRKTVLNVSIAISAIALQGMLCFEAALALNQAKA